MKFGKFGAATLAVLMAVSVAACDSGPSKDVAEQVIRKEVEQTFAAAGMATMGMAKAKLVSLEILSIKGSKTMDGVWDVEVKAKTETSAFGQKVVEENQDVLRLRKTSDGKFVVIE